MVKPLFITPMMSAPTTVPQIVPTPPIRLVPPSTTAAIASSSQPLPQLPLAPYRRLADIAPASPENRPLMAYTNSSTRPTRMPVRRAACRLPPMAQMCMPSTVLRRMTQDSSTTATATQISQGTCRKSPLPIHSKLGISLLSTEVPSASRQAAPRKAVIVPSVTTKALMLRKATMAPLIMPITNPERTKTGIDHPGAAPSETCMPSTADTASTEPTDRSMPAVRMTKVMPAASTRLMATWRRMFMVFSAEAKLEVPSPLRQIVSAQNSRQSTTSTGNMPSRCSSHCAVEEERGAACAPASALCIMGVLVSAMGIGRESRIGRGAGIGGQAHDVFLGDVSAAEFARDAAFTHHQHAVADADHLRQFAGDDDHGHALSGQLVDKLVDLALGIDIHTARGFVQDQHARGDLQPARQQYLLLVATGELAHRHLAVGDLDVEPLDRRTGHALQRAAPDQAQARIAPRHVHGGIGRHRHLQEQALALAILRDIGDALAHGRARTVDLHRHAIEQDIAGTAGIGTEEQPCQLGATGTDQARQPQYLTGARLEGRRPDLATGQASHLQHRLQSCRLLRNQASMLVELAQRTAHHHLHDALGIDLLTRQFTHEAAIAQHRHAIGQGVYLGHAVADVDDRQALVAQPAHHAEKLFGLAFGQRRGRLVHDEDAAAMHQRAGDLHLLLLGNGQPPGAARSTESRPQLRQHRIGAAAHGGMVDQAQAVAQFATHEDIGGHADVGRHRQFLVDQVDAGGAAGGGIAQGDRFSVQQDLAVVRRMDAGQHFHQRALAGAVLPHQRVDLAGADVEVHVRQRPCRAEGLADAAHLQYRSGGHGSWKKSVLPAHPFRDGWRRQAGKSRPRELSWPAPSPCSRPRYRA
eukprot:TRINITY_DN385_c0_g1_i13.p1 TRINITY_DN385_c0_g1~~TRINITY_DN385_c0_g1_i13.p1  ORF type:complete len:868 (-),score=317.47 TRINITY_DN385_c0_g1_i13:3732-6335(-)